MNVVKDGEGKPLVRVLITPEPEEWLELRIPHLQMEQALALIHGGATHNGKTVTVVVGIDSKDRDTN